MVASTIDGARVHAGLSFAELADRAEIPTSTLADLLEGRQDFTVVDLVHIATALGVPVTALLPGATGDGWSGAAEG